MKTASSFVEDRICAPNPQHTGHEVENPCSQTAISRYSPALHDTHLRRARNDYPRALAIQQSQAALGQHSNIAVSQSSYSDEQQQQSEFAKNDLQLSTIIGPQIFVIYTKVTELICLKIGIL